MYQVTIETLDRAQVAIFEYRSVSHAMDDWSVHPTMKARIMSLPARQQWERFAGLMLRNGYYVAVRASGPKGILTSGDPQEVKNDFQGSN